MPKSKELTTISFPAEKNNKQLLKQPTPPVLKINSDPQKKVKVDPYAFTYTGNFTEIKKDSNILAESHVINELNPFNITGCNVFISTKLNRNGLNNPK